MGNLRQTGSGFKVLGSEVVNYDGRLIFRLLGLGVRGSEANCEE